MAVSNQSLPVLGAEDVALVIVNTKGSPTLPGLEVVFLVGNLELCLSYSRVMLELFSSYA